jgi:hypothetical protein
MYKYVHICACGTEWPFKIATINSEENTELGRQSPSEGALQFLLAYLLELA